MALVLPRVTKVGCPQSARAATPGQIQAIAQRSASEPSVRARTPATPRVSVAYPLAVPRRQVRQRTRLDPPT